MSLSTEDLTFIERSSERISWIEWIYVPTFLFTKIAELRVINGPIFVHVHVSEEVLEFLTCEFDSEVFCAYSELIETKFAILKESESEMAYWVLVEESEGID